MTAYPIDITACLDGPILVRGAVQIIDSDGVAHNTNRPVVAACRCGKTGLT